MPGDPGEAKAGLHRRDRRPVALSQVVERPAAMGATDTLGVDGATGQLVMFPQEGR